MKLPASFFRSALSLLAALLLSGCVDSARSQLDEEKEPHFMAGKSRVSTMDYQGAIEAFEKALEVNPQSASAHFELGWLYEQKEGDPAAAIYHYDRFLRLRPKSEKGEIARQHILACKQILASTVSLGPITERQQRDYEKILDENKRLTDENKRLADELSKARLAPPSGAAGASTGSSTPAPALATRLAPPAGGPTILVANVTPLPGNALHTNASPPPGARTHTVKAGETLAQIARKYGLKLDALTGANPGLDPRRLRVGQALVIPAH